MTLNKNQKLVLDYLKLDATIHRYPMSAIIRLDQCRPDSVFETFCDLSRTEEFEMLAEFGKWGLENGQKIRVAPQNGI